MYGPFFVCLFVVKSRADVCWVQGMPVGWEPDDDGFRGYVFATEDNSTVVLTIKGTSVPIIGGGPTIEKDKLNDNLLFSCCCARVSSGWTPVCDCFRGNLKCHQECVEDALIDDSLFYPTGVVRNLSYFSVDRLSHLTLHYPHGGKKNRICTTTLPLCTLMQIYGSSATRSVARLLRSWGSHLARPSWRSSHQASAWLHNVCTSHLPYVRSPIRSEPPAVTE